MFFNRKRHIQRLYKRYAYGKTPLLDNKSGFLRKKKNIIKNIAPEPKKIKKIIIAGLLAGGILVFIYWIFLSPAFKINEISIEYIEFQSENAFIKDYFNSLMGKNIIFAKTESIVEKIKKDYPEFKSLVARKKFPHAIIISFSEYPLIMNVINYTEGGGVYKFIINEIGYAAQSNIENPNLPYVKIATKEPFKPNSFIISKDKIDYITGAANYFETKFKMKILESEYKIYARELRLKTEKYFTIMLDAQKPYEEQFLKLKKALVKLDIYNTPLEYIDLRIYSGSGEKIIFKKRK